MFTSFLLKQRRLFENLEKIIIDLEISRSWQTVNAKTSCWHIPKLRDEKSKTVKIILMDEPDMELLLGDIINSR